MPVAYDAVVLGESPNDEPSHRQLRIHNVGCIVGLPRVCYSADLFEHYSGEPTCLFYLVEHLELVGIGHGSQIDGCYALLCWIFLRYVSRIASHTQRNQRSKEY